METNEIINHLKETKYITSTKDNKTIAEEAEIEGSNPLDSGSGENSVVINAYDNAADGEASVALGMGVQAENDTESAFGKYNKSNDGTIHSVGIGTDDDHRENAFEILDDGSVYVKGIGGYTGANPLPGTNDLQTTIAGIKQFTYTFADTLPEASVDTMYVIYFIPAPTPAQQNNKDEYITVDNGEGEDPRYAWEQIGSATVDLSAYSTTAEMNAAIAAAVPWEAAAGTGSVIVKGSGNVANNNYEVAAGVFNKSNTGTQFSVGIGTGTNNRKNALEVKSDGTVYVNGVGGYDGTTPTSGTNDLKTTLDAKPNATDVPWEKGTGNASALLKGSQSTAGGAGAVAEGSATTATGAGSHTEGRQTTTTATGEYAHAEGYLSQAQQAYSHAEGFTSIAGGQFSHAEGAYAQTTHAYEHAEGIYNKSNTKNDGTADENKAGTTQMSIGVGASDVARANAFEVMQNGDVYVKGVGGYDGTNPNTSGVSSLQENLNNLNGIRTKVEALDEEINGVPTFGGLQISSGPLAYENGHYVMKEGWNHSSYNVAMGKVEGSTYFNFLEMGELFEKSGFSTSDGDIENLLDPFDGWRIPTSAEWCTLTTGEAPGLLREGSIVNGASGKRYAVVKMKDGEVTYSISTSPLGLLLFPDGCNLTIKVNGANINYTNVGTVNNNMTLAELNSAISQGCAFIPGSGYGWGSSSWQDLGKGFIRSSSSYDTDDSKSLYFLSGYVYPMGRTSLKQAEYCLTIFVKSVSNSIIKRLSDVETEVSSKADAPASPTDGHLVKVNASGGLLDAGIAMVKMTKAEYDALVTKDPSTVYLVEDYAEPTFGGLVIAPSPLYYGANGYEIKDNDWFSNSYSTNKYGSVEGSYCHSYLDLGKYMDSRGANFDANSGIIDNNGNKISYDGKNDWRLPTEDETRIILDTLSPEPSYHRTGSLVNGTRLYRKKISVVSTLTDYESALWGYLIFPDDKVITGKSLSDSGFTESDINNYVSQGCIFIHYSAYYNSSWNSWNYSSSSTNRFVNALYSTSSNDRIKAMDFASTNSTVSDTYKRFYHNVLLCSDTVRKIERIYLGSVLIADSNTINDIASILATI